MDELVVNIPTLPKSTNALLGITRTGHVYKTSAARAWAEQAALIIGAANQGREWSGYWLEVVFDVYMPNVAWRDVDNCIKLALDTLAAKLGFDDRYVLSVSANKWWSEKRCMVIKLRKMGKCDE